MLTHDINEQLRKLISEFNFKGTKKYKLIVLLGLLGDFDSLEYGINLKNFVQDNPHIDLNIFGIAIGNENGKEKFCNFTGFPNENLKVVSDNKIHNMMMISKGMDVGFGGWINMILMLSGINSLKTIKEVLRGYTGDKSAAQIFSEKDQIKFSNFLNFSGNSFKKAFGEGYLRPFELATFRLNNMIEIIKNWDDYILTSKFLPQRGASFVLDNENKVIYKYYSTDVLGYSSNMNEPLKFLTEICK